MNKTILGLALSLGSVLCATTGAEAARSCPTVDLRAALPEIRDQQRTGWCHAFAASDVLSFKMGWTVSATDIARNAYKRNRGIVSSIGETLIGGNDIIYPNYSSNDLQTALDVGVCNERFYPFKEVQHFLGSSLEKEYAAQCNRARTQVPQHFQVRSLTLAYGQTEGTDAIAEQLSKGNIVAIDYDAYNMVSSYQQAGAPMSALLHVSTVVGSRPAKDGDGCEFLVRGSWGPRCHSYNSKYECEGGNVWVKDRALSYMLYGVSWLE